jgi:hypothetical protein
MGYRTAKTIDGELLDDKNYGMTDNENRKLV